MALPLSGDNGGDGMKYEAVAFNVVKAVEKQSSKGTNYLSISSPTGMVFSLFPNSKTKELYELAKTIQPGQFWELEYETTQAGYHNIVGLKPSEDFHTREVPLGQPVPKIVDAIKMSSSSGSKPFVDRERAIGRMACINSALKFMELSREQSSINLVDVLNTAKKLENWIYEEESK